MTGPTQIKLSDVNGQPSALVSDLPSPLRVGDRITLRFTIRRENKGRLEKLDVDGEFRVTDVSFDAKTSPARQVLSVQSEDVPKWKSVKKPSKGSLAPAKFPRTKIR